MKYIFLFFLLILSFQIGNSQNDDKLLRIENSFFGFTYYDDYDKISNKEWNSILALNYSGKEIRKYRNYRSVVDVSKIFGSISGFLFGWQIGGAIGGQELNVPVFVGSGVVMLVFGLLESSNMKKMNNILYQPDSSGNDFKLSINSDQNGYRYGLTYNF